MSKSRSQRRSRLQEDRVAEDIGGRVQAGSGTSWKAKSDVRVPKELRVECKYTEQDHYVLSLDDLKKIQMEAILGGIEDWAMQVEFVISHGHSMKFAVVPYAIFKEWWEKTGTGELYEGSQATSGKTIRLKLNELHQMHVSAAVYSGGWLCGAHFVEANKPTLSYGVTEWSVFLDLREKAKSCQTMPVT